MKLFKSKHNPKPLTLYAVKGGDHLGKFVLFIDPTTPINDAYDVLFIGQGRDIFSDGFEAETIPIKDVKEAFEKNILDKVDRIDNLLYDTLYKEWTSRKHDKEEIIDDEFID